MINEIKTSVLLRILILDSSYAADHYEEIMGVKPPLSDPCVGAYTWRGYLATEVKAMALILLSARIDGK